MKKLLFLFTTLLLISCSNEDDNPQESNYTEIIDTDGNVYSVQLIADQYWTIDNLKTKIMFINIGLIPILIAGLALIIAIRRPKPKKIIH